MKARMAVLASECYLKAHAFAAAGAPTLAGLSWLCGNLIVKAARLG